MTTSTDQILLFPGAVPPEFCRRVAESGDELLRETGKIGAASDGALRAESVRNSEVAFFPQKDRRYRWMFDEVHQIFDQVNEPNWRYGLSYLEDIQYSIYGPGEYYSWHTDVKRPIRLPSNEQVVRKLSLTIQLDPPDAYQGGYFEVRLAGAEGGTRLDDRTRQQGSLIVFPASIPHRVTMVTSGARRSLVAWASGPVTGD